jgi:hypothetical protein
VFTFAKEIAAPHELTRQTKQLGVWQDLTWHCSLASCLKELFLSHCSFLGCYCDVFWGSSWIIGAIILDHKYCCISDWINLSLLLVFY